MTIFAWHLGATVRNAIVGAENLLKITSSNFMRCCFAKLNLGLFKRTEFFNFLWLTVPRDL